MPCCFMGTACGLYLQCVVCTCPVGGLHMYALWVVCTCTACGIYLQCGRSVCGLHLPCGWSTPALWVVYSCPVGGLLLPCGWSSPPAVWPGSEAVPLCHTPSSSPPPSRPETTSSSPPRLLATAVNENYQMLRKYHPVGHRCWVPRYVAL